MIALRRVNVGWINIITDMHATGALAGKKADPDYTSVRLWEPPDVRATRVEIKAGATRAVQQHDDVKFDLFIPLTGKLQRTIGSHKPVHASVGQTFYIKGATPHGFRNLGSTQATVMGDVSGR